MSKLLILILLNLSFLSFSQTDEAYIELRKNLQNEIKMPRELSDISEGLLTFMIKKGCEEEIDLYPIYYSNHVLFIKNRENILNAVAETNNIKSNVYFVISILFVDVEANNKILNSRPIVEGNMGNNNFLIIEPVVIKLYPKISKNNL